MIKVSSFDVFDTVLTRKVGSPKSSFLLLGKKLRQAGLIKCSAETFALIRENAEERAFRNAGGLDSDTSLDHIYQEVGHVLGVQGEELAQYKLMERELESELLVPIPKTLEIIEQARNRKDRIIFISDMYMEHSFIMGQLLRFGIAKPNEKLYLSKDYKSSKFSGSLYRQVLEQEGIRKKQLYHCGNHDWSDVQTVLKLGINASPFLEGNLNRYEQIMEEFAWMTEGLSSAMAGASGASRLTRLSLDCKTSRDVALQDVALGVAAPTLVGFTLWVLKRSQELGLERLYFLSRDGQILVEIANRIISKLNLNQKAIYLYGSRQAWLLPSLTDLNEEQLNQVLPLEHDVDHLSPKVIFSRFNITLAEIKSNLAKIGFSTADWDRNLGREERVRLHKYILSDLEVQRLIISKAFEKREVLTKYLAQVNLLENSDFGLVDLGTGATLHNALAAILETQNIKPPNSFYLGLRKVRSNKFDPPEPYLYNEIDRLGFMNIPGIITFLESVCSADHGSVVDYSYAHNSDEVHPVFKEESNQAVTDWGYPLVRTAILNFTDNLLLDSNLLNPFGDVRALIETLQKEFWLNPTLEESKAWGNFPLEDGWGKESKFLTLAAPYSFRDLPKLWWLVFKTGDVWLRRHWWHSASLKMSPPLLKITFCSGEKIIKLVKKSLKKL